MPSTPAFRSTFYLLEGIAVIVLTTSLFVAPQPGAIATLILVLGGRLWRRVRQASWFALVALALFDLVVDPTQTDPYVLGLAAIYILFNSGLLGKNPLGCGIAVIVLTMLCQGKGLAWNADQFPQNLFTVIAIDAVLTLLALVYKKQFMGLEHTLPRQLPVLDLAEKGLTEAEVEVLRHFLDGRSVKEIADELEKSGGAIRIILSRIYDKLRVANGRELERLLSGHQVSFPKCQDPPPLRRPHHICEIDDSSSVTIVTTPSEPFHICEIADFTGFGGWRARKSAPR